MSKKTILMSAYSCDPYGVSESFAAFNFFNILLKRFKVILLTTHENEIKVNAYYRNIKNLDFRIISFRNNYPGSNNKLISESLKLGYFIFNYKIHKYLKENVEIIKEADLLYHKSPSGFRYVSALSKFDKPFVLGPTGGGLKPPKELKDYFKKEHPILKLRNFDRQILNSNLYCRHFASTDNILITLPYVKDILGKKYGSKYFELFDTGIDTEKHKLLPNIEKKQPVSILYMGKLTRYKGAELLIRAASKIEAKDSFVVDIYGDGEEKKFLQLLSHSLGINDNVKFHGLVPHERIPKIYSESSIFCFPTITEASGNSLLEAMSYSLPIITINNGGPKYMCPSEGSIKIEIETADNMILRIKDALNLLLKNEDVRKEMGAINREHCVKNYDWKVIEGNILSFFQKKLSVD